jgi:hypothetical protein
VNSGCTTTSTISYWSSCGTVGTYNTIKALDGRCWFTSNLPGYYQWNRITQDASSYGWRWIEADSGDPCPTWSHTPSYSEWGNLTISEGITNIASAQASSLHLSADGYITVSNDVYDASSWGPVGAYWSSTLYSTSMFQEKGYVLYLDPSDSSNPAASYNPVHYRYSVRCIVNE